MLLWRVGWQRRRLVVFGGEVILVSASRGVVRVVILRFGLDHRYAYRFGYSIHELFLLVRCRSLGVDCYVLRISWCHAEEVEDRDSIVRMSPSKRVLGDVDVDNVGKAGESR